MIHIIYYIFYLFKKIEIYILNLNIYLHIKFIYLYSNNGTIKK